MLKNYLKITVRNMMKNKVFVLINIFGLGMALACCIVAFLNWDFNTKFDTYHTNTDDVYRVNFVRITNDRPIKNGSCPLPLGEQIKTSIAGVDKVMRYFPVRGNFRINNEVFSANIAAVDPEFIEVFNYPIASGNVNVLSDKQSIVISDVLVKKHFSTIVNPVGETLTYIKGDIRMDFLVAGIFEKPPKNNSFYSDAYIPYENTKEIMEWEMDDWSLFNNTFVRLTDSDQVEEVEKQLQDYVAIQNEAKQDYKVAEYYLDPFQGMAVRSERENIWNHWFNQSLPTAAATAPGIMALLILLIACFNFTNTSIAIANRRIKEIGIRKVLGSNRKQLIFQFMGENVSLVVLAMIAGLIMSVFLVPAYSAMWPFLEIELNFIENLDLFGFLFALLLFTAFVACSYPAIFISRFRPTEILRGEIKYIGTNAITRVLLTSQYAISLLAIICGFVFSENATFQKNYDMGFDIQSIIYAEVNDEQGYNKLRNELAGTNEIKEIAGSRHSLSSSWYTDPIKTETSEMDVNIFDVGAGYLSTIGATLLHGRDFVENSATDAERSVIINEKLANSMGWDDPINQRIVLRDTVALTVIGVVKNIFFEGGLWDPLEPMLMRYSLPSRYRYLTVKTSTEDLLTVKSVMDEKWKVVFPEELSKVDFMDENKASGLLVNSNIKVLFVFLGIVAAILSVIGLFSMVSLNLLKRMKEIGVRKVFGASIQNIAAKVSKEFMIILLIASLLGSIGGYFLSEMLMGNIWTYYVPLGPTPFIISVCLLILVSLLTISGKVFKAASANPSHTLGSQ